MRTAHASGADRHPRRGFRLTRHLLRGAEPDGLVVAEEAAIAAEQLHLRTVAVGRRPVDLRAVKAFVLIAEEGSFTKVAGLLFLSQPSLTKLVQQLERDLGCRLLRRSSKRSSLTAHGEAYLPDARTLLAVEREAREALARVTEPFCAGAGG